MKRIIITALALMALTSFGSQQTQEAEARARHIAEVQRARAERIKREIDRAGRMNSENMQAYYESLYDRIEEKKCNLNQSLEAALVEERARRKARLAAKEAETNKRLVKKLAKESAGLRSKNEQLRKELDKTINELAEYRSQAKHLSSQLRSLPKSLGRGASSGPARRRK